MNIKPLHDRVIVKRDEVATRTEGGIELIKEQQKRLQKGIVVAVGPGRMLDNGAIYPMTVGEGNRVLLPMQVVGPFEYDGEQYEMMKEVDILGVIQ